MPYILILLLTLWISPSFSAKENHSSTKLASQVELFLKEKHEKVIATMPYVSDFTHKDPEKTVYVFTFPREYKQTPVIGFHHFPNNKVHSIMRTIDDIIYDVHYTIDSYGRRTNPNPLTESYQKFALFFGCSFTMGIGIEDDETIASYLTEYSQSYYGHNYAIGSSGTHMMLATIEAKDFKEEIPLKEGVFIYVFNDFHIERANYFMVESSWLGLTPYYQKKGGELVYQGPLEDELYLRSFFYPYLRKLFNFLGLKRNFPTRNQEHITYTCDLIKASKKKFLKLYPTSRFLVYAHPLSLSRGNEKLPRKE